MKKLVLVILVSMFSLLYAVTPSITFGGESSSSDIKQEGIFYVDVTMSQPIFNLSLYGNYRNGMKLSSWEPLRFSPSQDFFTVGASCDIGFAILRLEYRAENKNNLEAFQNGVTRFEMTIGD